MFARQAGSSLIELTIAVMAGIMLMSMMMTAISNVVALGKAKREGEQLAAGAAALDSYLRTHGESIARNGTAPGFADPLHPTFEALRGGAYLASFVPSTTPFGGTLSFMVRKGAKSDLLGLVCDTQNINERGLASPYLASEVMMASNGTGLRTSIANPAQLNGPGFTGVASPINGPAIVCAWAYRANPL
jgi:type II secretory pathway pseudopilin PulG